MNFNIFVILALRALDLYTNTYTKKKKKILPPAPEKSRKQLDGKNAAPSLEEKVDESEAYAGENYNNFTFILECNFEGVKFF